VNRRTLVKRNYLKFGVNFWNPLFQGIEIRDAGNRVKGMVGRKTHAMRLYNKFYMESI